MLSTAYIQTPKGLRMSKIHRVLVQSRYNFQIQGIIEPESHIFRIPNTPDPIQLKPLFREVLVSFPFYR